MNHSSQSNHKSAGYHRYHIETRTTPDLVPWPPRFNVIVKRAGLAKLLISEIIETRGDMEVVTSRPCMYGVFSGPVGGFAPRPKYCVGCLRCTTQYPEWVKVEPNPARQQLGDSYFTFNHVNAVAYEAETGSIPVKGAGYRGKFGGEGWDGMWTDMSEIVRPTRDGIHGREFISTAVDIGAKPNFLSFDPVGKPVGEIPNTFSLPIPMLFDVPPAAIPSDALVKTLVQAAEALETLAVLPIRTILAHNFRSKSIVPLFSPDDLSLVKILPYSPRMVEMEGWNTELAQTIRKTWPEAQLCLRMPFGDGKALLDPFEQGIRVFHLEANYHGQGPNGVFIFDLIRAAHKTFVEAGLREKVTLLGSGGIVAAEHVPKAIVAGLDAVLLDTPVLVALQARFAGDFTDRYIPKGARLPKSFEPSWGVQRLKNLVAAWRDQLLEILGAMGLREVRRLRGEIGRAMFQKDLERDAFNGIDGYPGLKEA